ncbi:MAG: hypothetical protein SGI89_07695 [bacterium]|nr:hypothetical protein [bacterium]
MRALKLSLLAMLFLFICLTSPQDTFAQPGRGELGKLNATVLCSCKVYTNCFCEMNIDVSFAHETDIALELDGIIDPIKFRSTYLNYFLNSKKLQEETEEEILRLKEQLKNMEMLKEEIIKSREAVSRRIMFYMLDSKSGNSNDNKTK